MRAGSPGGGTFGCLGTNVAGGGGALRGGGGALYLSCGCCGCGCGPGLLVLSSRWPLASSGCCGSSCDWGPCLGLGSSRRLPSPPNGTNLALFGLVCAAAWLSSRAWLEALTTGCTAQIVQLLLLHWTCFMGVPWSCWGFLLLHFLGPKSLWTSLPHRSLG